MPIKLLIISCVHLFILSCSNQKNAKDYEPDKIIDLEKVDENFSIKSYYQKQMDKQQIPEELKNISYHKFSQLTYKFDELKIDPVFIKDTLFLDKTDNENKIIPQSFLDLRSNKNAPKPNQVFGYEYQILSILKQDSIAKLNDVIFPELYMAENTDGDFIFMMTSKTIPENEINKKITPNLVSYLTTKYGNPTIHTSKFTGHDLYDWNLNDILVRLMPTVTIHGKYKDGVEYSERFINLNYVIFNKEYIPIIKSLDNSRFSWHQFDFNNF